MTSYFLDIPASVSVSNLIETVNTSNFDVFNMNVFNTCTVGGDVDVTGNVNIAANLTVVNTIFCTNLSAQSFYIPTLSVQSNVYVSGSYIANDAQPLPIEVIDSNGMIPLTCLKGYAPDGKGGSNSVLNAINTGSAVLSAIDDTVQAGTSVASVFGKVGSLFGDGAKTAESAVADAVNKSGSDGNAPFNGGSNYVSFSTNLVNKPFDASSLHFANQNDLIIGDSSFIKSGISTGFGITNQNVVFNGSTQNIIDCGSRIAYFTKVDMSNSFITPNGITYSNGNSNYSIFGVSITNSNITLSNMSTVNFVSTCNIYCQNILSSNNTLNINSSNGINLTCKSNLMITGLSNSISGCNITITGQNSTFTQNNTLTTISQCNSSLFLTQSNFGINIGGLATISLSSNGNLNGLNSLSLASNLNTPAIVTSNNNTFIQGNLYVSGGIYGQGILQLGGGILAASNSQSGLYGVNGASLIDTQNLIYRFYESVDSKSLQAGTFVSNKPVLKSQYAGTLTNPFG